MSFEDEQEEPITLVNHFKKYGKLEIIDKERDWRFQSDGKSIMRGKFKKGQNML